MLDGLSGDVGALRLTQCYINPFALSFTAMQARTELTAE